MSYHDDTTDKVPLTSDDVALVIKNSVGPTAKVLGYRIQRFSKETIGFLGSHHRMTVSFKKDDGTEEKRPFFVKYLPYNHIQLASCLDNGNFLKETTIYREVMPEFLKSIKNRSWCARCYLTKEDALVFEDLSSRNFSTFGTIFDADHMLSALSSLAGLHGASLLTQKRQGHDFLRGVYPEVIKENVFLRKGMLEIWMSTGTDLAVALAKHLGLNHARIPNFLDRVVEIASAPSAKWNVICHGDPWVNNFLFDDSKPLPQCVLVDYQLTRYASPMFDLSQFFYFTTRRHFREQRELELLTHYHRVLSESLRENDDQIELPQLDEILQEYEEMRVVGISAAVFYFPLILFDGKLAAELDYDFETITLKDRVDFVLSVMEKDKMYEDRINEVIREMVERAEKLF